MSDDVKKLSDVFKASPQVTSLDNTDCVLAVGADGGVKKISGNSLSGLNERTGAGNAYAWVRALGWSDAAPMAGTLYIASGYWSGNPRGIVFAVGSDYRSTPSVTKICGNTAGLTNVRFVRDGDNCYLDFYIYGRKYSSMVQGMGMNAMIELNPDIPSSATTIEIPNSDWGG